MRPTIFFLLVCALPEQQHAVSDAAAGRIRRTAILIDAHNEVIGGTVRGFSRQGVGTAFFAVSCGRQLYERQSLGKLRKTVRSQR
jgi:hypothetical protein